MAAKPSVTLYLADGSKVLLALPEDNPTKGYYDLLNREGEYATGWVSAPGGYEVNLLAVLKIRAVGV